MLRLVSAIACASALCAQSVVVPNLSANTAATTVLEQPVAQFRQSAHLHDGHQCE